MSDRVAIKRSVRFEVFKRDKFTCQYCGKMAPDIVLHVDHIDPVKNGGVNDILNLVTSCQDCNLGKGARLLSDHSVVKKQVAQLAELQDRKEQLEMMMEWRKGLGEISSSIRDIIQNGFEQLTGASLNDSNLMRLEAHSQILGLPFILDTIKTCCAKYLYQSPHGLNAPAERNLDLVVKSIFAYVIVTLRSQSDPHIKNVRYIIGILRNRFRDYDKSDAEEWLRNALELNIPEVNLRQIATKAADYSDWTHQMNEIIEVVLGEEDSDGLH